ncbi:unnamed protein product, partial [Prorocentrum cordatum]
LLQEALAEGPAGDGGPSAAPLRRGVEGLLAGARAAAPDAAADEALARAAREEVVTALEEEPQLVLDLLGELREEERSRLLDLAEQSGVLPRERRGAVEAVVMPGAHAEQLGWILKVAVLLYTHSWVLPATPAVEFAAAYLLVGSSACSNGFVAWLRCDAALAVLAAAALYVACSNFRAVYHRARLDPAGEAARALQAWKLGDLEEAAEVLEMGPEELRAGAAGLGAAALVLSLGAVGAVVGALKLVQATLAFSCSPAAWLVCGAFAALRLGTFVALCYLAALAHGLLARGGGLGAQGRGSYGSTGSNSSAAPRRGSASSAANSQDKTPRAERALDASTIV